MKLNLKQRLIAFWKDEDGLGTLEILLIVAVLVAIAIIFRKWIGAWFKELIGDADANLDNNSDPISCEPGTKGC